MPGWSKDHKKRAQIAELLNEGLSIRKAAMTAIFHRPELAESICGRFTDPLFSDTSSGLFLAAPRRTGKSTSLRFDLIPAMEGRGWQPIYTDLWEAGKSDPGTRILNAIIAKAREVEGPIAKLAKTLQPNSVSWGNIEVTFGDARASEGGENGDHTLTLTDLLARIVRQSGKPVALVVDEAQVALDSESGIAFMYALKAARDALSQGETPQLFLVFTGSHRDKLGQLVLDKSQPFFGAYVTTFPTLGKPFTDFYTDSLNKRLAVDSQLDPEAVYQAFGKIGHKPEELRRIIEDVAFVPGDPVDLNRQLLERANAWEADQYRDFADKFSALSPIQQAVLVVIAEYRERYAPFSASSMARYKAITGNTELTPPTVQNAIEALRGRGYVWKSARGVYALEDESWENWLSAKAPDADTDPNEADEDTP